MQLTDYLEFTKHCFHAKYMQTSCLFFSKLVILFEIDILISKWYFMRFGFVTDILIRLAIVT